MFLIIRSFGETRRAVSRSSSVEVGPTEKPVFVVVSRQAVIESRFSTVVCAPVYSAYHGLASQVEAGIDEGLKHPSSIHCDELVSLPKTMLTDFVGSLSKAKIGELNNALLAALDL